MIRYILLGILALLLLLLFVPVKVEAVFRNEVLSLRLRLLWLVPISILPAKEKKPRKEKPSKKPKEKKQKEKHIRKGKAPPKNPAEKVLDILELVNDLVPNLTRTMGYILGRLTLSRCRIALIISGEEADEVGIACGRAYAAAYAAQSVLRGTIRVKEFTFHVLPDFISGNNVADAEVTLALRPSTLLAGGLLFLLRTAKTLLTRRKSIHTDSKTTKGGVKNGSQSHQ